MLKMAGQNSECLPNFVQQNEDYQQNTQSNMNGTGSYFNRSANNTFRHINTQRGDTLRGTQNRSQLFGSMNRTLVPEGAYGGQDYDFDEDNYGNEDIGNQHSSSVSIMQRNPTYQGACPKKKFSLTDFAFNRNDQCGDPEDDMGDMDEFDDEFPEPENRNEYPDVENWSMYDDDRYVNRCEPSEMDSSRFKTMYMPYHEGLSEDPIFTGNYGDECPMPQPNETYRPNGYPPPSCTANAINDTPITSRNCPNRSLNETYNLSSFMGSPQQSSTPHNNCLRPPQNSCMRTPPPPSNNCMRPPQQSQQMRTLPPNNCMRASQNQQMCTPPPNNCMRTPPNQLFRTPPPNNCQRSPPSPVMRTPPSSNCLRPPPNQLMRTPPPPGACGAGQQRNTQMCAPSPPRGACGGPPPRMNCQQQQMRDISPCQGESSDWREICSPDCAPPPTDACSMMSQQNGQSMRQSYSRRDRTPCGGRSTMQNTCNQQPNNVDSILDISDFRQRSLMNSTPKCGGYNPCQAARNAKQSTCPQRNQSSIMDCPQPQQKAMNCSQQQSQSMNCSQQQQQSMSEFPVQQQSQSMSECASQRQSRGSCPPQRQSTNGTCPGQQQNNTSRRNQSLPKPCSSLLESLNGTRSNSLTSQNSTTASRRNVGNTSASFESLQRRVSHTSGRSRSLDSVDSSGEQQGRRGSVPALCPSDRKEDLSKPKCSTPPKPKEPEEPPAPPSPLAQKIMQMQHNEIVADTYCPGILQDTINGCVDLNKMTFKMCFGECGGELPNCIKHVEPMTLLTALVHRLTREKGEISREHATRGGGPYSPDEVDQHFAKGYKNDVNKALSSFIKAQVLGDFEAEEVKREVTFDVDIAKGETMCPVRATVFTCVTTPK